MNKLWFFSFVNEVSFTLYGPFVISDHMGWLRDNRQKVMLNILEAMGDSILVQKKKNIESLH